MNNKYYLIVFTILFSILQSCSSAKVVDAWKAEQPTLDKFKQKKVLVIARTANNQARIAFEQAIANRLRSQGVNATESFTRAPVIHAEREMTEERMKFIKSMLDSEGYNGIVLTVIKDKQQHTETSSSGMYVGASYSNYYPSYYGGFYNYYSYPYANGYYYDSFGGYIPFSSSTRTVTNYVLETVAYNLDEPDENQIVAVVTTNLEDPKQAYKTAGKYVDQIVKHLNLPK
jgi:hypothetical protein